MDYKALVLEMAARGLLIGSEGSGFRINPYLDMPVSLGFSDVATVQQKNVCKSRLDVDISSEFVRGLRLGVPLIASNMSTVTDVEFCVLLDKLGSLGILHRAWPSDDVYISNVKKLSSQVQGAVAVSVGAGDDQVELAFSLIRAGANVLTIDIAHGYSDSVRETAEAIKEFAPSVKVIAGNTTNVDMMHEFDHAVDAIKIGIAGGLACRTKNTAGSTERQFSTVEKFKEVSKKLGLPVISDGACREPADVVKAIGAGASSVMLGSAFARCPESAAPEVDGKKLYAGMASEWVQQQWKGGLKKGTCAEGAVVMLDMGQPVAQFIERYSGALRSGITYAGASDIKTFQEKVRFIRV